MVEPLMNTLLHSDPASKAWPIRIFPSCPLESPLATLYLQIPGNIASTLGDLFVLDRVLTYLQTAFFGNASSLDTCSSLDTAYQCFIQGFRVDFLTPMPWIHRHLVSMDGWINIIVFHTANA